METTTKATKLAADYLGQLGQDLATGSSDTLVRYLETMARFHRYSMFNIMLIAMQRPSAVHVAGYGRWKQMGRYVRAGEKGIMIIAPCSWRKKKDDAEAQPDKESSRSISQFTTAYVWDVEQTDGEPLPEFARVSGDVGTSLDRLKALVLKHGIGLAYTEDLGGARGISHGGSITILSGLEPAEDLHTLAHELAHELLHRGARRIETTRQIREVEAEAVAYVVSRACGLETSTASWDYVRLYGGNEKLLNQSLGFIQKVSAEILDYVVAD